MKKKMIRSFVLIMLAAGLTGGNARAEEPNTLTLNEALEIALGANLNLKQAANQVASSQISVNQKKANFYPDLGLSSTATKRFFKEYDTQTGDYNNDDSWNLNLNASSSINLFNGFYDTASLQQSRFQLKAAEGILDRTSQAVIFETIQRYVQAVTASEAIDVEMKNLESQKLQLIRIDAFCKAGRRPIADLYQQQAEIASAEYRILDAKRNYEEAKLLLKQTLGLEIHTNYQVVAPDIDSLLKATVEVDKERDLALALKLRPDVNAEKMQVEAAGKGVKASLSGYFPTLSLYAELGTTYNSQLNYSDFSNQFFDGNLNGTVGLSLSIPVFDKSRTKSSVASARLSLANQQLENEKLEKQVSVEVQEAIEDYHTARKQIDVTATRLEYTKAALDSVQERYNVNAATMVELTQARSQYLEALLSEVEAKYALLIRGIAVAYYTGDTDSMFFMAGVKK
jgi:outer membrane protein